ncbi:hypothetical protein NOR_06754 [Metarhizium rileyi]|uniref:Uncharacterized protein n=1 Tax=Metarhizium rileyi (strain RCEF 4871) TaxID=1649241 RepID=A0A166ZY99_METRR|nr:hypothetical protein NOR_06754 [Metarhizium rileyi RCEF 4871]
MALHRSRPRPHQTARPSRRRAPVVDTLNQLGRTPGASRPVAVTLCLGKPTALAGPIRPNLAQRHGPRHRRLYPPPEARGSIVSDTLELKPLTVATAIRPTVTFDLRTQTTTKTTSQLCSSNVPSSPRPENFTLFRQAK